MTVYRPNLFLKSLLTLMVACFLTRRFARKDAHTSNIYIHTYMRTYIITRVLRNYNTCCVHILLYIHTVLTCIRHVTSHCITRYESEQPFATLQLGVKHKDLDESLKEFIKGDLLEGDNAYNCEKCGKKVSLILTM